MSGPEPAPVASRPWKDRAPHPQPPEPDAALGPVPVPNRRLDPGRRAATASRRLRTLAGVDEQLLAWVPSEQARYTALGGVVLGTAVIATISMTMALSEVLDGFNLLVPLVALVWGLFILNLDRWLVSSTFGARWGSRLAMLLPRLVLAFFFGVVIAEPLVLRIFEPAIEQHINDERQQELRDLGDRLLRCNPDPTAAAPAPEAGGSCMGSALVVLEKQTAAAGELAGKQQEQQELRDSLAVDDAEQTRRDVLASKECTGTVGEGTTGRAGRGEECRQRESEAADFRRDHPLGPRTARLADLDREIGVLQSQVAAGQDDFQKSRSDAIQAQTDEKRSHQGAIGLLERFRALDELTATNSFLLAATWFVRLFFIAVDCLPVVVKFFGGKTLYEELVDTRGQSAVTIYRENTRTVEAELLEDLRTQRKQATDKQEILRETSDLTLRWKRAQLDQELQDHITELADRMDRRAQTAPTDMPTQQTGPDADDDSAGPAATNGKPVAARLGSAS